MTKSLIDQILRQNLSFVQKLVQAGSNESRSSLVANRHLIRTEAQALKGFNHFEHKGS